MFLVTIYSHYYARPDYVAKQWISETDGEAVMLKAVEKYFEEVEELHPEHWYNTEQTGDNSVRITLHQDKIHVCDYCGDIVPIGSL